LSEAPRYTIQGQQVTIPVEVRDASAHMASFFVPAAAAQDLIAYSDLEVAEPLPGRAVCTIAFMRYVDSDLGPYHEVAVAFLVRHKGMEPASTFTKSAEVARGFLGAFIHQLPVNQEFTLEAGRDIWGFPKFLADIDLDLAGGSPAAPCTTTVTSCSRCRSAAVCGCPHPGRASTRTPAPTAFSAARHGLWSPAACAGDRAAPCSGLVTIRWPRS